VNNDVEDLPCVRKGVKLNERQRVSSMSWWWWWSYEPNVE